MQKPRHQNHEWIMTFWQGASWQAQRVRPANKEFPFREEESDLLAVLKGSPVGTKPLEGWKEESLSFRQS